MKLLSMHWLQHGLVRVGEDRSRLRWLLLVACVLAAPLAIAADSTTLKIATSSPEGSSWMRVLR